LDPTKKLQSFSLQPVTLLAELQHCSIQYFVFGLLEAKKNQQTNNKITQVIALKKHVLFFWHGVALKGEKHKFINSNRQQCLLPLRHFPVQLPRGAYHFKPHKNISDASAIPSPFSDHYFCI
jgi:hypothetical protein